MSELPHEAIHPLEAEKRQRAFILTVVRWIFFAAIIGFALLTILQASEPYAAQSPITQPPLTRPTMESPAGQPATTPENGAGDSNTQPGANGTEPPAGDSGTQPSPRTGRVAIPAQPTPPPIVDLAIQWWIPVGVAICMFLLVYLIDRFTPNKKISTISGVFLGLLVGLLATVVLGLVLDLVLQTWGVNKAAIDYLKPLMGTIKVMLGLCLCYLGVTTVLQTQDEFRIVLPYVEFAKQVRGVRPMVLDTSALIDGRIADVAATGLIQAPIVVPRFVLAELQLLADSADKLKRAKGRRGLDIVARLQRQGTIDVKIDDTAVTALSVDQMLVELAAKLGGARLMTTDLALTRVAQIHGVVVLNLHEIANTLKPTLISGQQLLLRMVKPGEQAGQAVGYLEDGTMVVAEAAAHKIGQDALLLVTGSMQTTAGRLVFARLLDASEVEAAYDDGEEEVSSAAAAGFGGTEGMIEAEPPGDTAAPPASAEQASTPEGAAPGARPMRQAGPPSVPKGAPPNYRRPGSARNPRR
jgi:uncharacterized protein YacL